MERDGRESGYHGYGGNRAQPSEPVGHGNGTGSLTYHDDALSVNSLVQRVEIVVQGQLDASWSAWFDGMTIEPVAGGTTVLRGVLPDQAALHGMLARVRDLGLPLRAVTADPYFTALEIAVVDERSKR